MGTIEKCCSLSLRNQFLGNWGRVKKIKRPSSREPHPCVVVRLIRHRTSDPPLCSPFATTMPCSMSRCAPLFAAVPPPRTPPSLRAEIFLHGSSRRATPRRRLHARLTAPHRRLHTRLTACTLELPRNLAQSFP
jgi:hypothetical protein